MCPLGDREALLPHDRGVRVGNDAREPDLGVLGNVFLRVLEGGQESGHI